jgi:hypothetical protein
VFYFCSFCKPTFSGATCEWDALYIIMTCCFHTKCSWISYCCKNSETLRFCKVMLNTSGEQSGCLQCLGNLRQSTLLFGWLLQQPKWIWASEKPLLTHLIQREVLYGVQFTAQKYSVLCSVVQSLLFIWVCWVQNLFSWWDITCQWIQPGIIKVVDLTATTRGKLCQTSILHYFFFISQFICNLYTCIQIQSTNCVLRSEGG